MKTVGNGMLEVALVELFEEKTLTIGLAEAILNTIKTKHTQHLSLIHI